jgi:hypothetical protein
MTVFSGAPFKSSKRVRAIGCQLSKCQHISDWRSIRIRRIGKCTCPLQRRCTRMSWWGNISTSKLFKPCGRRWAIQCRVDNFPPKKTGSLASFSPRRKEKSNNYFFRIFKGITYGQVAKFEFEFCSPFGKSRGKSLKIKSASQFWIFFVHD